MREFTKEKQTCLDEQGREHMFRYAILVDEAESGGLLCEDYGIKIEEPGGGVAAVRSITPSRARIEELLELLIRNAATPINLAEVVQDWL